MFQFADPRRASRVRRPNTLLKLLALAPGTLGILIILLTLTLPERVSPASVEESPIVTSVAQVIITPAPTLVVRATLPPKAQVRPALTPTLNPTATPQPKDARLVAPVKPKDVRLVAPANTINGVALSKILVWSDAVKQNIRQIFAKGQKLGRNPRAFSKVGDSTMVYPPFLAAFDDGKAYNLGPYEYLQPTIDHYAGSFARTSAAAKKGMHTWTEFDPAWVTGNSCNPGEGPLACELRLNRPSIVFIRLGANDVSAPKLFDEQLRKIVAESIANGTIPVLGTKPDKQEGPANTLNQIVKQVASSYKVPLWDYDLVAGTIPSRGLEPDHVHMVGGGTHDYELPEAFASGDSLEDLTALMMLDSIRREVVASR